MNTITNEYQVWRFEYNPQQRRHYNGRMIYVGDEYAFAESFINEWVNDGSPKVGFSTGPESFEIRKIFVNNKQETNKDG